MSQRVVIGPLVPKLTAAFHSLDHPDSTRVHYVEQVWPMLQRLLTDRHTECPFTIMEDSSYIVNICMTNNTTSESNFI